MSLDIEVELPVKIQRYCRKHKIRWNHEGTDVYEFVAPKGCVFANESRYRIIELEWTQNAQEVIDVLGLQEAA